MVNCSDDGSHFQHTLLQSPAASRVRVVLQNRIEGAEDDSTTVESKWTEGRQKKSPDSDKHSALVHPAEAGVNDIQVRHGNLKPVVLKLPPSRFKVNTQEQIRFRTSSARSASRYAGVLTLVELSILVSTRLPRRRSVKVERRLDLLYTSHQNLPSNRFNVNWAKY